MPSTDFVCLALLSLFNMVAMGRLAFAPLPPSRFVSWSEDPRPQPPISPVDRRRWRLGWVLSLLLLFGLAVTSWRYMTTGDSVSVPASAPLIDHLIFIVSVLGSIGEFAVMCVYVTVTRQGREDRSRPGNSASA